MKLVLTPLLVSKFVARIIKELWKYFMTFNALKEVV